MVVEKVQLTIITRMSDDPIYTHQGRRNVWGHGGMSPPPHTHTNQRGTDYAEQIGLSPPKFYILPSTYYKNTTTLSSLKNK